MAGFGLLRELLLENQLIGGCVDSYSWPNGFCVVFVLCQPLRSQWSPIISSLDVTHHFEV